MSGPSPLWPETGTILTIIRMRPESLGLSSRRPTDLPKPGRSWGTGGRTRCLYSAKAAIVLERFLLMLAAQKVVLSRRKGPLCNLFSSRIRAGRHRHLFGEPIFGSSGGVAFAPYPWQGSHHGHSCRSRPKWGATPTTRQDNLIRMFIDGPDVSLNGSPTVSPVTAASWASEPL